MTSQCKGPIKLKEFPSCSNPHLLMADTLQHEILVTALV